MQRCQYNIEIYPADNGFVVHVGCKKFVVAEKDVDVFLSDLRKLLVGGYAAERELRKQYLPDEELLKEQEHGLMDTAMAAPVRATGRG